jgi:hypothetical protein
MLRFDKDCDRNNTRSAKGTLIKDREWGLGAQLGKCTPYQL